MWMLWQHTEQNSTDKQICNKKKAERLELPPPGPQQLPLGSAQTGNSQRQNIWIVAEVSRANAWLMKTENYLMWSQWKLPVSGLPLTAWWICARAGQTRSCFPSLRSPSAPRLNWKTPADRMILSDNMMGLGESHWSIYSFKQALCGCNTLMEFYKTNETLLTLT